MTGEGEYTPTTGLQAKDKRKGPLGDPTNIQNDTPQKKRFKMGDLHPAQQADTQEVSLHLLIHSLVLWQGIYLKELLKTGLLARERRRPCFFFFNF
jgi:hypothetical protein